MNITHGMLEGQVLQRLRNNKANAAVTGSCSSHGPVCVTIRCKGRTLPGWNRRKVGRARDGMFAARLVGIPVGGPYEVTLSTGTDSVVVHRLWVGDVWLLAGQSNMQGCGNLHIAPKPHPLVHAMYMDDHWDVAREPIHFLADSPDKVHWSAHGTERPNKEQRDKLVRAAVKGVGPGIFFGAEMVKRSRGAPQGLLCTAHGGTSMEQWDPEKQHLGGDSLYGSMLRTWRKTGQPVAGALWYQGESDCTPEAAPLYSGRMKQFVAAIRRDLNLPRLPFLLVQIGRVFGTGWNAQPWNSVQSQQVELKRAIPHYDVVATIDLPLDDQIHVGTEGYARLGVRLARLADRMVYGNRRELPAPELARSGPKQTNESKGVVPYRLVLKFNNVVGTLRAAGEPTGFDLVDGNHNPARAFYKTIVRGNEVILESAGAPTAGDAKLMYGHGCAPYVNITDARDMAIPVFASPRLELGHAVSPFVIDWMVSAIQPGNGSVETLPPPQPSPSLQLTRYRSPNSFVDQHPAWNGKSGQALFFSEVTLSEPMKLQLQLGYDGPFKLWIEDEPIFCDLNGTNPAIPDRKLVPVRLREGKHQIAVAMDLNNGRAWGFFLRFSRTDVSKARIEQGDYAVPVCSL